ncbi:hypothetical protein BUUB107078_30505 [Burkholderia ubonensis]|nr:hypothetical protein BUB20358_02541 [Burkholderia ubonensis]
MTMRGRPGWPERQRAPADGGPAGMLGCRQGAVAHARRAPWRCACGIDRHSLLLIRAS